MKRAAHTYVQLCGQLVVELRGRRVEQRLPSRQGRALFAYLVLQRPRAVGRDELIEAIWSGAAPRNHAQALTVLLSPYMPESTAKLLAALGDERIELSAAVFGDGPGGGAVGELPQLFPKPQ